jgi:phage-related protein (TIGR01555 family)
MARAPRTSVKSVARKALADQKRAVASRAKLGEVSSDSFQNFALQTGIGTGQLFGSQNQSNPAAASTYGFNPITNDRAQLDWMYRGSWICGKAVDAVADDMTRAGIEINSSMAPEDIAKINSAMQRWVVWPRLNQALKWSRLYGGAIAVISIDGQNMSTPLDWTKVGKGAFRGLQVFDRWQLNPSLGDLVSEMGPDLGLPKFYEVVATAPGLRRQRIHHSRAIRLEGVEMPYWQKLTLNFWGCSVFEPLYDRLVAFDSTSQGTAQLVYKAYLRTLKIDKLRAIIASGGQAYTALLQQVSMMKLFQSNEGITLVDKEDEFEAHNFTFAGLSDVLLMFAQQLSGATGIPLVRLFGQSPAGLNATGESDLRNYYDNVNQSQELKLRISLDLTLRCIAQSEGIAVPDGFGYSFVPLWQLTAKEKAEVAEIDTRVAQAPYDAGIISAATVLRELKQSSITTGRWTNITDKEIDDADQEPVDPVEMAGLMQAATAPEGEPGQPGAAPAKPGAASGKAPGAGETPTEKDEAPRLRVAAGD